MKIATRYLAKEIYTAMLATVVVLLVVFLSNLLVRFMHSAAIGELSGNAVRTLLLLQLPILSAVLLPASLFLGILFAYGRLYADSEMVVLSACGFSSARLLRTTINFSVVIMVIVGILAFWVNPKVYKYFDHIHSGATSTGLEMIKTNQFNEIADGKWVFYVDKMSDDKETFYDVFAAEEPNGQKQTDDSLRIVTAKSAYQKIDSDSDDLYMILVDGYRYIGKPGQRDYEVIKYDEYGIQIQQDAKPWYSDASSASTLELWNNRQDRMAAAELHWRMALPLSVLILVLLAVPLSKVRPKGSRYAKLAPAILLYIIYANFLFLAKAWVRREILTPEIGMWWVHGFMLLLAIILIGQQAGWWRGFGKK